MLAPTTDAIPQLTHGWTPELKTRFLDHLAHKGNVRAACKRVGLSREAAYRARRRDPLFARGWAAALLKARDVAEEELGDRAIEGIEEPIYYRGELVGTRRRYDGRLLLAHLARLDRLVDEKAVGTDAARFDELLASIAGEPIPEELTDWNGRPLTDRDAFCSEAAERAECAHRNAEPEEADEPENGGEDGDGEDGDWEYEDGDDGEDGEDDFDEEALEAECRAEGARARAEAAARWDGWRARTFSIVDALSGWPAAPVAHGLPGNPFTPAAPHRAAFEGAAYFSPRTVSDVSSSALARALAGPARGFRTGANRQPPTFSPRQASRD